MSIFWFRWSSTACLAFPDRMPLTECNSDFAEKKFVAYRVSCVHLLFVMIIMITSAVRHNLFATKQLVSSSVLLTFWRSCINKYRLSVLYMLFWREAHAGNLCWLCPMFVTLQLHKQHLSVSRLCAPLISLPVCNLLICAALGTLWWSLLKQTACLCVHKVALC